tara:strand:- start:22108 stop:22476 length:369 start_codon:yes stop_codon:yes gene_type:complete
MKENELSPFFPLSDIECKCGCGQAFVHEKHYSMLVKARERARIGFPVSSWNRCEVHNETVGGSVTSSHLTGWAVDIACVNASSRYIIMKSLIDAGFNRIGVYSWGIHADCDPAKGAGVLWVG